MRFLLSGLIVLAFVGTARAQDADLDRGIRRQRDLIYSHDSGLWELVSLLETMHFTALDMLAPYQLEYIDDDDQLNYLYSWEAVREGCETLLLQDLGFWYDAYDGLWVPNPLVDHDDGVLAGLWHYMDAAYDSCDLADGANNAGADRADVIMALQKATEFNQAMVPFAGAGWVGRKSAFPPFATVNLSLDVVSNATKMVETVFQNANNGNYLTAPETWLP